jgi:phosphomannomutase
MTIPNFTKEHADFIISNIDAEAIRAKKFKIVVDMINASACVLDPYLFEQLNIKIIPVNDIPDGKFGHKPEPTIENLATTAKIVKDLGADLGFAHDPDADRLVIINEFGEVISEDYTLAFGVEDILSKNPGNNVVINMSTSNLIIDIAKKYKGECFRTKVGEANVLDGIIKHQAIIGGEGTSGVIYPTINTSRDSFVSLSLALELLTKRNMTVSQIVSSFPRYFMKRDKWPIGSNLEEMYKKLKIHFDGAEINDLDGLRLDFPDKSWLHLRPSITEPIIRLFGEAKTQERIDSLFNEAKLTLNDK